MVCSCFNATTGALDPVSIRGEQWLRKPRSPSLCEAVITYGQPWETTGWDTFSGTAGLQSGMKSLGRQPGRLSRMECGLESLNSYTWEDGGGGVEGLGRLQHGRVFRMECGLECLNSYTWEDGGLDERSWETTAWEIILGWNVVLRVFILIHGRTGGGGGAVGVEGLGRLEHGRLFRVECGLESLDSYTWQDGGGA